MNPDHELFPGLDALHYLDYKDNTYVRMDQVTAVASDYEYLKLVFDKP